MREFEDSKGKHWQVWQTKPGESGMLNDMTASARFLSIPTGGDPSEVSRFAKKREQGWLTFRSGEDRRRLSPIPADWETCPPTQLLTYLRDADVVESHSGKISPPLR